MTFAICRIQKIKSWGVLTRSEVHTSRLVDIPNANPEIKNMKVVGNNDNLDLATLVRDKIGSQKIRSDAVLAVEMLLSASAEYFRPHAPYEGGSYDKPRLDKFVDAVVNWLNKSWGNRIVQAELHLDEITPHIHAYLVPLNEHGKLNCKALFGTRAKMHELQDSFAAAVAHLGLLRGIKGSVASHQKIRKYYAAVNQDSLVLDLERCLPQPQAAENSEVYRQKVIEVLSPQLEIINYQLNERSHILQQKTDLKETASRSELLRQQLEKELNLLQASRQNLPVELVAYELGLNPDKQFHGTAIDLVMGINQCNFNDAVIWLCDRFGETKMLQAVHNYTIAQASDIAKQHSPVIFAPPLNSPSHWQQVEYHLNQKYSIPPKLLQTLNQRGLVYADNFDNGVFLARNLNGQETGAYLYSLKSNNKFSLHPGSRRSSGWFHLSMGGANRETIETAMLVDSPINALCAIACNVPHKHRTLYLTLDSQHAPFPLEILKTIPNVIVAMSESRVVPTRELLPRAVSQLKHKEQQQYY
ncbi:MobV family relaxase [Brunnivagina elsteri]|uniref:Plasmid recombination protein n=1 Tax=Brunnivagina elsteri CCALA 953 TaxID=987040 RepID=A0A2A2TAS8_9CYAN|nr:MobV family relaxase [Calothrix elsteri]PAX47903.1 plasmid recombination protein [Calothrix elsteri CCALA 953]